jgi:hypothetical protein
MEDLINKYLEKSLTEKELLDFNQKLLIDPELKAEVEFQKSVKSAIHSKERTEIKSLISSFEKKEQKSLWWRYAVAAIVIIVGSWVVFKQFISKPSSSELYLSYYQTYPNLVAPNVRGEANDNLKTKAFAAYDNGEFELATQLFGELKGQINEDYVIFYEGISNLEINKPEKTIVLFENKKFENSNFQLEDYRLWYLALAYLKADKKEYAKKILKEVSTTNELLKKQTLKLLDEL